MSQSMLGETGSPVGQVACRASHDADEAGALYRDMFHASAVSAWHLDTSGLVPLFRRLQAEGASDLFVYARENPRFIREAQEAMRIIDVNGETLRLFGATDRSQIVGGSAAPFWIEGRNETFLECINVTFAGSAAFRGETWLRTLDGREIYVLFTKSESPRLRAAGEALLSIVDLTGRVEAQRALEEARANLAHSARVSLLGELTASIAHEVNQPMTAIRTYGEAGLRWLNHVNPDLSELRDVMTHMIEAADRAAKVIGRIRSMVTPAPIDRHAVSLNDLVVEAMQFLGAELRKLRIDLDLLLSPGLPDVLCDPVQLQQVVINLALNAMHAMEHAEVRHLSIRTAAVGAGHLHLVMADTGTGIDPAHADQLFESFFTTKAAGMGIGLGVCRSIVEAHGGTITVANRDAGGVEAGIIIPVDGSSVSALPSCHGALRWAKP